MHRPPHGECKCAGAAITSSCVAAVFVDAQLCTHQEGQTHAVMKRHVCSHISHIVL